MAQLAFTPKSKKITIYTDFKKTLEKSPVSADLTLWKDEDAVKESIKNLILTDKGERLMQPNLGGNIRALLFENLTPGTLTLIQDQVETTIRLHEPRAEIINVIASTGMDENTVTVKIIFYVRNVQQPITLDVFLERTR